MLAAKEYKHKPSQKTKKENKKANPIYKCQLKSHIVKQAICCPFRAILLDIA